MVCSFRIENWDIDKAVKYKLMHGENATYEGFIRKDPISKKEISIGRYLVTVIKTVGIGTSM